MAVVMTPTHSRIRAVLGMGLHGRRRARRVRVCRPALNLHAVVDAARSGGLVTTIPRVPVSAALERGDCGHPLKPTAFARGMPDTEAAHAGSHPSRSTQPRIPAKPDSGGGVRRTPRDASHRRAGGVASAQAAEADAADSEGAEADAADPEGAGEAAGHQKAS